MADSGKAYRVLVYNTKNGATTASAVTSDSATATVRSITLSTPTAPVLTAVSESTTAISVNYSTSQVSNTSVYSIALYLASDNSLISTVQQSYSSGVLVFSGLTPNTGYYAKVTAIGSGNYGNSSASSASTTVLTNALPATPTISSQPAATMITSGNTTSVSVTAARTDGGTLTYKWQFAANYTAPFYDIDLSSGTNGSVSSSNTGSTYTSPTLTYVYDSGVTYRVLVYNNKNGARSSAVTSDGARVTVGAILLTKPSAPTGAPLAGSATSASITYSPVSNATVYGIRIYKVSGDQLVYTGNNTYSDGVAVVTGLDPDTSYYAVVSANGSGNYSTSDPSNASASFKTNNRLSTPTLTGSATSGTLKSIQLGWTSPTTNAVGYSIRIYDSTGSTLLDSATVSSGSTITKTITASDYANIADGTSYKFAIVALGSGSNLNSLESDKISVATNSVAGSLTFNTQPQGVSKVALQTASFSVSASGDGSLSYQWQYSTDKGITWNSVSGGSGATTNAYTTASLDKSYDGYRYRVQVTNTKNGTTSTATSDDVLLTVALANQSPLIIATLQGHTEVALSLIATGGSTTETISYSTISDGCTISGAVLTRTTVGDCVIQAIRPGNATVYNDVISQTSSIHFLLGDGNVDVDFSPKTGALEFEYQSSVTITVTVVESGKVQFMQDGRAIPGCTAIRATPTAPAVCTWKPSSFGYPKVTAVLTPTNPASPTRSSAIFAVRVYPRV